MLVPIITFLSSSAGGALIGFLQSRAEQRREDKATKREARRQADLAHNANGLALYEQTIKAAQTKPIRYTYTKTQTRLKWFLWGEPLECTTIIEKDKLSQTPREFMSALMVFMILSTYCLCTLWVAVHILAEFNVIPPDAKQAGFSILGIFKVEWGGNKPIEQSGLSSLLYMLSPLVFISSNWIIRKPTKK